MSSFVIHSRADQLWSGLSFLDDGGRLVVTATDEGVPDAIVQAFDPGSDTQYRVPGRVSPQELAVEIGIHFPRAYLEQIEGRPVGSVLGDLVLIQLITGDTPAISPLAALTQILESTGSVNSAILQADNGGLLFVRRAGDEMSAHASTNSLKTFLKLSGEARDEVFPDFQASELIVSGSDLDHFEQIDVDPIISARRISVDDLKTIVGLSEEARKAIELAPHLYTLAVGAASVFAQIRRELVAS